MTDCVNGGTENGTVFTLTPGMIVTSVILLGIVVIVLLGNSLVITAVIKTRKLRTVTNIYIVSLACSDLLLGICVLPYSASYEVLDFWPFGDTWCSIWLAIDVLLCTASILNLCAISLDRFLAVTSPIKYPSLMSKRRGKILVSCVWILSLLISIPPLLGWNDKYINMTSSETTYDAVAEKFTNVSSNFNKLTQSSVATILEPHNISCVYEPKQCILTQTTWYRIYASMGSFYIPSLIMIFFYCRIYIAAARTASSLRSGILTSKKIHEFRNNKLLESEVITMRVHRGGNQMARSRSPSCVSTTRRTSQVCYPDLLNGNQFEMERLQNKQMGYQNGGGKIIYERYSCDSYSKDDSNKDGETTKTATTDCVPCIKITRDGDSKHSINNGKESPYMTRKHKSPNVNVARRSMVVICDGRTSQKQHIRKFLRETKAAKTVAIIIGAFILCWLPFFIIYLLGAFCTDCTPPLVFSILFWLGYCNSMLNPFIYGLFSRDFRFAFRRLLICKISRKCTFCSRNKEPCYKMRHHLGIQILESESLSDF